MGHASPVGAIAVSRTGNRLASSDEQGMLAVWDTSSCRRLRVIDQSFGSAGVEFIDDETFLAADVQGCVSKWSIRRQGELLNTLWDRLLMRG